MKALLFALFVTLGGTTLAAQTSLDSFASAPAAEKFMSMIDASTMTMTRSELAR